ncbi:MAG: lytic transglycosylase [Nitrosomonadales bacterium SCN 54-20]|nr:MAG: lytic transglycosylase [Nitrosomonadales bacterium SCN 54-20]
MSLKPSTPLIIAILLSCGLMQPASAEIIYSFTDEHGVVHFSNVPADERYVPFIGSSANPRKSRTASNNGHPVASLRTQYGSVIKEVARAHALEDALLHAVVTVESAYNPRAVSKKGAAGLMQLMPETAQRYGVTDRFDPVQNLHGGARYLTELLRMFNGNLSLTLAAYNAGENNVIKYGNRIPPFQETRNYVPKVLDLYRRYHSRTRL